VTRLREDRVRLRCEQCQRTLDWYWHTGDGSSFCSAYLRKSMSRGPNGWRAAYECKCGATPVLLLDKLMTLVPTAHQQHKSILTSYLLF
jgi:hypothetical protein